MSLPAAPEPTALEPVGSLSVAPLSLVAVTWLSLLKTLVRMVPLGENGEGKGVRYLFACLVTFLGVSLTCPPTKTGHDDQVVVPCYAFDGVSNQAKQLASCLVFQKGT